MGMLKVVVKTRMTDMDSATTEIRDATESEILAASMEIAERQKKEMQLAPEPPALFGRIAALEHRLDEFQPNLGGERYQLETIIACLQCNADDAYAESKSFCERLDVLERRATEKAQADPVCIPAPSSTSGTLFINFKSAITSPGENTEAINYSFQPATLDQIRVEYER